MPPRQPTYAARGPGSIHRHLRLVPEASQTTQTTVPCPEPAAASRAPAGHPPHGTIHKGKQRVPGRLDWRASAGSLSTGVVFPARSQAGLAAPLHLPLISSSPSRVQGLPRRNLSCTFLPRVQITCTPYRRWPSLGVGREAEAQGAWGLRPPRCCLALTRSCPGQAPRATRAGGRADGEDRSKIRPAVSPSRRLSAVRRTSAHTAEGPGGPGLASP